MKEEKLCESLKTILERTDSSTRFGLMESALMAKQFDFVKTFCNPDQSWNLSQIHPEYTNEFVPALLFSLICNHECDLQTVQFLCENYQFDINILTGRKQMSLLQASLQYGDLDMATYLISRGADPKAGMQKRCYFDVLTHAPKTTSLIERFEFMYNLDIPIDRGALTYAIYNMEKDSAEVIKWLVTHGGFAGSSDSDKEGDVLEDIVQAIMREEIFSTDIWLEKIKALLDSGFNPNPIIGRDYNHSEISLLNHVALHKRNGCKRAEKVESLLKEYSEK